MKSFLPAPPGRARFSALGALRLALCVILVSCRPGSAPPAEPALAPAVFARVLLVMDGDTIVIGGGDRVKLIGVDAPEIRKLSDGRYQGEDQPWGPDAFHHLSRLLLHRKVGLQFEAETTDAEGRTPAYLILDGELLNARLLEEGYGRYDGFAVAFGDRLKKAEASARARGRGVWEGSGRFTPPRYGLAGPGDGLFHDPGSSCAEKISPGASFRVSVPAARRMGLSPCPGCLKRLALEDLAAD
jgi:micrococcal nuclease